MRQNGSRTPRGYGRIIWTAALTLLVFQVSAVAQEGEKPIDVPAELLGEYANPDWNASHARLLQWLREGGDPNMALDTDGNTMAHFAPLLSRDILDNVIRNGGECNRKNRLGETPLHYAAVQDTWSAGFTGRVSAYPTGPDSIRKLVGCGAKLDVQDDSGATPLHAVYPLSVFKTGNLFGSSSRLSYSVAVGHDGGHLELLRPLLEAGANPNIKDNEGNTPLMRAVKLFELRGGIAESQGRGAVDHVRLLLEHGANPDARDGEGVTPLILAVTDHDINPTSERPSGAVRMIRVLVRGGANPDLRDRRETGDHKGNTALIHAAQRGYLGDNPTSTVREIRALLAGGADPCLTDLKGKLAYDWTEEGSEERKALMKAGGYWEYDADYYRYCPGNAATQARKEKELRLSAGDRRRIQSCLKSQGFDPGTPDGVFGPRTRAALRGWQQRKGKDRGTAKGYLTKADVDTLLAACRTVVSPVCSATAGAKGGCWIEVGNRPGCYLWNPNPKPEETVTWSGTCVNGKASGKGRTEWRWRKDGEWRTSWGEARLREGKIVDGHVVMGLPSGTVGEGPFKDGKFHGLWVARGSGGSDLSCWRNNEQVSDTVCIKPADRNMQATRGTEVRSGPGPEYEEVTRLQAGQKVRVIGQVEKWLQVEINDQTKGFVRASLLEEIKGPAVGERFRDCPECPEMVVAPAGSFMMGSPSSEVGRDDYEGPVHRVRIGEGLAVGVYEVTFEEWDACVRGGGCNGYRPDDRGWGRGRRPVINVSWEDAQAYVRWLSRETGQGYRLLSEAEWEYVARAGSRTAYHWGGDIGRNRANCRVVCGSRWDDKKRSAPAGSFAANEFGLHDVHGNVSEWVEDCWNESYRGAPEDGSAWESGDCRRRVLRGGSWSSRPWVLRSAHRSRGTTGDRSNDAGFRVVRTLTP